MSLKLFQQTQHDLDIGLEVGVRVEARAATRKGAEGQQESNLGKSCCSTGGAHSVRPLRLCLQQRILGAFGFHCDSLGRGLVAPELHFCNDFGDCLLCFAMFLPWAVVSLRLTANWSLLPLGHLISFWVGANGICPLVGRLAVP